MPTPWNSSADGVGRLHRHYRYYRHKYGFHYRLHYRYHRRHATEAKGILKELEGRYGPTPRASLRQADAYARDVLGHTCYAPWLYVYAAFARTFKEGWIPDNFYGLMVVPQVNGDYGRASGLKSLTSRILRSAALPDLALSINGLFIAPEGHAIAPNDLSAALDTACRPTRTITSPWVSPARAAALSGSTSTITAGGSFELSPPALSSFGIASCILSASTRGSAARAVAEQVTDEQLGSGLIYPHQSRIFEASMHTATRVAETLFDEGLAQVPRPDDIGAFVRGFAYRPVYSAFA